MPGSVASWLLVPTSARRARRSAAAGCARDALLLGVLYTVGLECIAGAEEHSCTVGHVADRREQALARFEAATELPLLLLALVMIPLLLAPLLFHLSSGVEAAIVAADWLIWAAFAFEYVARLVLTPAKWRFVRREWFSLLIVVLPFLRPLRVVRSARALRLLRLARLGAVLAKGGESARRVLTRHGLHYTLVVVLLVLVGGASAVLAFEEGAPGASIGSLGDALWWAVTTMTTVGYGDYFPTTPGGRGVAVFLMFAGIAVFGVITANVASFFFEQETEKQDDRLDEILERLARIEERLAADHGAIEPP